MSNRYDLGLIGGALIGITQAFSVQDDITKEVIVGGAKFGAVFGVLLHLKQYQFKCACLIS